MPPTKLITITDICSGKQKASPYPPKSAEAELPFALADLEGKKTILVPISLIPVQDGKTTKTIDMELNVVATVKQGATEYLVTGNCFTGRT